MENSTNNNPFANVQFFNAVGKRTDSTSKVESDVIIAEGTLGSFKMMPEVAAKLGVTDGSFVTVQTFVIDGVTRVAIGKGKDGVLQRDEEGNVVLDNRKRRVFEKDGFGAMLSEVAPGTNVLRFSVASAWKDLGMGEGEVKKLFKLGEGGTVVLPIGEGDSLTTELFMLEFLRDEAKQASVGTKKSKDDAPASEGAEQAQTETAQAEEASPAVEDNFTQGFEESEL